MRIAPGHLVVLLLSAIPAMAASIGVNVNTSAIAGQPLKVVFDVTANQLFANSLNILSFSAPGSTMQLPETSGGLISGDLILVLNPASLTNISTGAFFNELIVNLNPVGNSVSFTMSYTTNAPSAGNPPDEISFFLLDQDYAPLFPTSDPLGANALFTIDLTGPTTQPVLFSPTTQSSPGQLQIVVPGANSSVPEPDSLLFAGTGIALFVLYHFKRSRRCLQC